MASMADGSRLDFVAHGMNPVSGDLPVGQTIVFCRLFEWACGPRNFMKKWRSGTMVEAGTARSI
jgi:hypothetical protein